ncbi:MAG: hypothetical protein ACKPJD_01925, partial [Planctomycetaceae bacterium]
FAELLSGTTSSSLQRLRVAMQSVGPLLLGGLTLTSVVVYLGYAAPKMSEIFVGFGVALPWVTELLLSAGMWISGPGRVSVAVSLDGSLDGRMNGGMDGSLDGNLDGNYIGDQSVVINGNGHNNGFSHLESGGGFFQTFYAWSLRKALKYHRVTSAISAAILIATIFLFGIVPKGFIPNDDLNQLL